MYLGEMTIRNKYIISNWKRNLIYSNLVVFFFLLRNLSGALLVGIYVFSTDFVIFFYHIRRRKPERSEVGSEHFHCNKPRRNSNNLVGCATTTSVRRKKSNFSLRRGAPVLILNATRIDSRRLRITIAGCRLPTSRVFFTVNSVQNYTEKSRKPHKNVPPCQRLSRKRTMGRLGGKLYGRVTVFRRYVTSHINSHTTKMT